MKNIRAVIYISLFLLVIPAMLVVSDDDLMIEPAAVVELIRPQMISMQKLNETYEEYRTTQQRQGEPANDSKEDILDILIENELLLQGAKQYGISVSDSEVHTVLNEQKASVAQQLGQQSITDAEFVQILDQYFGKTLDGFKEEIRNKLLVEKYVVRAKKDIIENVSAPTQNEVQSVYRQNATNFINPEFTKISHVFVSTRDKTDEEAYEKINKALQRLQSGNKSFSELVLEVSEDESTKFSEGELGWLAINDNQAKEQLGNNFFEKVFDLSTGAVSDIIESNSGYHIVKVHEHRDPKVLGLQDPVSPDSKTTVYQYISNEIFKQKQAQAYNRAIDELVESLRKEAEIKILL